MKTMFTSATAKDTAKPQGYTGGVVPQTESCASCLSFQLFQLGSTTSCSVLTSPNKDELVCRHLLVD